MGKIVIEDLEESVFSGLQDMTEFNHTSFEQEVGSLLRDGVKRWRRENRVAIADRIAAMTPKTVLQTDSTLLIREDRDR